MYIDSKCVVVGNEVSSMEPMGCLRFRTAVQVSGCIVEWWDDI